MYIYLTLNKVNGKTYIGQHRGDINDCYYGSGIYIMKAIKKYGKHNFEKFILQVCYSEQQLNDAEIFWIAEYKRRGKAEYNVAIGGQTVCQNAETGKKISAKLKGKHLSEETKKKMSESMKGIKRNLGKHWYNNGVENKLLKECPDGWIEGRLPLAEEHKKALGEAHKGLKHSAETVEKRRQSNLKKHRHLTEEQKKKMSESCKKHWKDHPRKA